MSEQSLDLCSGADQGVVLRAGKTGENYQNLPKNSLALPFHVKRMLLFDDRFDLCFTGTLRALKPVVAHLEKFKNLNI